MVCLSALILKMSNLSWTEALATVPVECAVETAVDGQPGVQTGEDDDELLHKELLQPAGPPGMLLSIIEQRWATVHRRMEAGEPGLRSLAQLSKRVMKDLVKTDLEDLSWEEGRGQCRPLREWQWQVMKVRLECRMPEEGVHALGWQRGFDKCFCIV